MNYLCHSLNLSCAGCHHPATHTQENMHALVQGDGQNRSRGGRGAERSEVQCNRVLLFLWVLCLWLYPSCPVNSREGQRDNPGTYVRCRLWLCVYLAVCWCCVRVCTRSSQQLQRLEGKPGHFCLAPSVTACLYCVVVGAV